MGLHEAPRGREPIGPDEAEDVLLPIFLEMRKIAASRGFSKVATVPLRLSYDAGRTGRDLGYFHRVVCEVCLSPRLALFPAHVQEGVVAHELGHAIAELYPAWQLLDGDAVYRPGEYRPPRDHEDIELLADMVAERVIGLRIHYHGRLHIQSTLSGVRPRPRGLRGEP